MCKNVNAKYRNLSSIWLLSCNDERNLITYKGINDRLGIDINEVKELVGTHRELFRLSCSDSQLKDWKDKMLANGNKNFPSWITNEKDNDKRNTLINDLKGDDIFRNQFRAKSGAERAEIILINWGLDYIERLRKDANEKSEKYRAYISALAPYIVVIITSACLIYNIHSQNKNNETQNNIRAKETELLAKQKEYPNCFKYINQAFDAAKKSDAVSLKNNIDNIAFSINSLEPFLSIAEKEKVWSIYKKYKIFLFSFKNANSTIKVLNSIDSLDSYNSHFKNVLYEPLFKNN